MCVHSESFSLIMDHSIRNQTLHHHIEKRKWLLLVGLVALTHLFCQSLMLPYGNALLSLLPNGKNEVLEMATKSSKDTLIVDASNLDNESLLARKSSEIFDYFRENGNGNQVNSDLDGFDFVEDEDLGNMNKSMLIVERKAKSIDRFNETKGIAAISNNDSLVPNKFAKKKMRCEMPPKTVMPIDEMERLLVKHHARSRAMRPRWSSQHDRELLTAKMKVQSPPIVRNDGELHAPLFRNISMFKRSYELMEQVLKIYVYKEGEKPIFHQPILKGLYASEGWFMKLMEGNSRFVVKDPRKAHLFYMPFSSRMLEYTLYVRNSHNRTNLRQYLKDYSEKIAAKYRFWNRTGGADHFLVACHDWAPYETRHHMEHCIKALCNADVSMGFKIGRDVSLAETYVRSARNPLRDLGGKPASQRRNLVFYAGNMHGYLRPILLKYWKDKEPDMKILGPMPPGVASRMNYIHQMKSNKYCICPKGYEVNSPRIVEAIFYECVPVIISDNFVPPFFEVLNWDSFSVIIAEKDIPNLKKILVAIDKHKYLKMQLNVRKVQKHFLWHAKAVKYDLFHMTLHSIWYNRLFQIKSRDSVNILQILSSLSTLAQKS